MRQPCQFLDRNAPPVPGMKDELTRYFDRDKTDPPLFKNSREFFQRTRRGEPQAKLYTRIDGRETLLFDPVALDPSGKTKIGAVVPNRDATRLAVGVYAQGSERKDFRIIDSTTGAQIGPVITGLDSFGWARDERYAFITPRTAESDANQEPMRCLKHRLGGERRDDVLLLAVKRCEELLLGLRARGGRRHRVRDRRFLVEHDSHPSARFDRGATDDLRERQVSRRGNLQARPHVFPHQRRRRQLEVDGGVLRAARVPRLDDADSANRRPCSPMRRSRARRSSRRRARTCCRSSSCTT